MKSANLLRNVSRIQVDLYGSLALTGMGHGTDRAILLGLSGEEPSTIDPASIDHTILEIRNAQSLSLMGRHKIAFAEANDLLFHRDQMFPPESTTQHPNGVRFSAFDSEGKKLLQHVYYSIGGGFIVADGDPPGSEFRNFRALFLYQCG